MGSVLMVTFSLTWLVYVGCDKHMGVDLNSFIRDPSFSPQKLYFSQTFAFLRLCCITVCHVCCVLFTSMVSSLLANTK